MKFVCEEISISDYEFGCEITFADRKERFDENQSYEEITESLGTYLSLQRSYGEDEFEEDYYTVELSDFEKSGELEDFSIGFSRTLFHMKYKDVVIDIEIKKWTDPSFDQTKEILKKIVNGRGELKISE